MTQIKGKLIQQIRDIYPEISIVLKSDIDKAKRFDAEYFRPEYLYRTEKLKQNFSLLKDFLIQGNYGVLPKSEHYQQGGIFLIRGKNLRQTSIEKQNLINVPNNYYSIKYTIIKNDILILVKGATIAFEDGVIIANNNLDNCIFNGSIFRIRLNKKIIPHFLFSFMSTRYFTFQKERGIANNGIEYNNIKTIKNYLIPVISNSFQLLIEKTVKTAHENQAKSKVLYKEAENLLLEELGLLHWKESNELTFEINKSEVDKTNRFDAEYFHPKYKKIVQTIKNYSGDWDSLGNFINYNKGIEVGSEEYKNEGITFLRVSNLSPFEITTEKYISVELYKKLKIYQPKKGEILLSKDASPGIAYYLNTEPNKMIYSSGIICLQNKTKQINNEYLTLVLNSILVQTQIERDAGGSIIKHWRPDQIENIAIPILKNNIQSNIQSKIKESFRLRVDAKQLLESAKKAVEMAIEKSEEQATHWLQKILN